MVNSPGSILCLPEVKYVNSPRSTLWVKIVQNSKLQWTKKKKQVKTVLQKYKEKTVTQQLVAKQNLSLG